MKMTMKNLLVNQLFKLVNNDKVMTCIPEMGLNSPQGFFVVNAIQTTYHEDQYIAPTHEAIFVHPDTEVILLEKS